MPSAPDTMSSYHKAIIVSTNPPNTSDAIASDIGRVMPIHFGENQLPLIVGDVHGQLDMLHALIRSVKFNHDFKLYRDPLIMVGDLTDRGPQCYRLLQELKRPNVYSTLGNHEMNYLRRYEELKWPVLQSITEHLIHAKEGAWFLRLTHAQRLDVLEIMRTRMPMAIQLSHPNLRVGILHANGHDNWWDTCQDVAAYASMDKDARRAVEHRMLYSAERKVLSQKRRLQPAHSRKEIMPITGVFMQVSGHISGLDAENINNCYYIDTGARLLYRSDDSWKYGSGRLTGITIGKRKIIEHWVRQVPSWQEVPASAQMMQYNGQRYVYGSCILKVIPLKNRIDYDQSNENP